MNYCFLIGMFCIVSQPIIASEIKERANARERGFFSRLFDCLRRSNPPYQIHPIPTAPTVDPRTQNKIDTLTRAIMQRQNLEKIFSMIDNKSCPNLNIPDSEGQLPLIVATRYFPLPALTRILLEHGANPRIRDSRKKCAFSFANDVLSIQFYCHEELQKSALELDNAKKRIPQSKKVELPTCCACQETIEQPLTDLRKLKCSHTIHNNCAHEWICHGQKTCPLCRKEFSTSKAENSVIIAARTYFLLDEQRDTMVHLEDQETLEYLLLQEEQQERNRRKTSNPQSANRYEEDGNQIPRLTPRPPSSRRTQRSTTVLPSAQPDDDSLDIIYDERGNIMSFAVPRSSFF